MRQERLGVRESLLRAHFDGLALAVEVNVAGAADHLHEGVDECGKTVRIDPGRLETRKTATLEFYLRLDHVVRAPTARGEHAFGPVGMGLAGFAAEEPAHQVDIV